MWKLEEGTEIWLERSLKRKGHRWEENLKYRKIAMSNIGERALRYPWDLMTRKLSRSMGE